MTVTAQDLLKLALSETVGPKARERGFSGSAPTWRKQSTLGDWAVVNVQSSSFSSRERLPCVINLAVAPEPWLRWQREQLGQRMPKSVSESLGLYRKRLHPTDAPPGRDVWWEVSDSTTSARIAVEDMVTVLHRDGWHVLDELLDRDRLLDRVRDGDLGNFSTFPVLRARAEALLLMDSGPSDILEARLDFALSSVTGLQTEHAQRFDAWVRNQARQAD